MKLVEIPLLKIGSGAFDLSSQESTAWSAQKWDVLSNMCDLAYWNRSGGPGRVSALLQSWIGFDEVQFIDDRETDVQLYVAVEHEQKILAVVFRGTTSGRDWLENLKVKFRTVGHDLKIHTGFVEGVETLFPKIDALVFPLLQAGYRLIVSGHSKGGAEALVFSILNYLAHMVKPELLFTIGQPRALSDETAERLADLFPEYWRGVHAWDLVPNVPGDARSEHIGKLIYSGIRGRLSLSRPAVFRFLGLASHHFTPAYINPVRAAYKLGERI